MELEPPPREARLKPEYAHLYPYLEPGAWDRASTIAIRTLEAMAQQLEAQQPSKGRALIEQHFDFRGGAAAAFNASRQRLGEAVAGGTFRDRVSAMRLILQSIEAELQKGKVPAEGLEDFKSAVDDLRLRVWSILAAASSGDHQAALERFRLRRAIELTRTLAHDLESGTLSRGHRELPELEIVLRRLSEILQVPR